MGVSIVVMGVQGVGKSTIGKLLAEQFGVEFIDGDDLHPKRNRELMRAGVPLTDADREPWLHEVGRTLAEKSDEPGVVVACSALKRSYREKIRSLAPRAYFVEPWGPFELVAERIRVREHDFMPTGLLQSQFDTLEPLEGDEYGIRVNVEELPGAIIEQVLTVYPRL